MKRKTTTKTIKTKSLYRSLSFKRDAIDEEARTVELSFSSEEPVERFFGKEILDHSPGSVRLGRLTDGGPVLVNHDTRDHVGVIESANIKDRRGQSIVRFGKSDRAESVFRDVIDGILRKVSVMYRIHKAVLEEAGDDQDDVYRITDWEPMEISLVPIPADATVGVGRSTDDDTEHEFELTLPKQEERKMLYDKEGYPVDKDGNRIEGERRLDLAKPAPAKPTPEPVDVREIETRARKTEQERVKQILTIGATHGQDELARQFVDNGEDVAAFNAAVLERKGKEVTPVANKLETELSDEDHRNFSLVRALNGAVTNNWQKAGRELEISRAIGKELGRDTDGIFIPTALHTPVSAAMARAMGLPDQGQRAPLVAGTTTTGGFTVATVLMPLIEILRNRMLVKQLGAQVLTGLQGDVAFPRQDGTGTLTWTGENPGSDVGESNATYDQPSLTPKTAQSTTQFSRQLLAQSSLDIENFVRNDLIQINALGLDVAAINGSGASNQPLGILNTTGIGDVAGGVNGLAPTWAHIVDLESDVSVANADMGTLAYLTNAKVRGQLKKTFVDSGSNAERVWDVRSPGSPLNGYNAGVSNQVPSNLTKGTATTCSAIIFGNWADLLIGEWGAIELTVDPYAKKKQGLIEVTSHIMVDITVRHPESFSAMQDALTP